MTIPASDIVAVNPGVVGTGGTPIALNGVFLTKNTLLPTYTARSFGGSDQVGSFFGLASDEYNAAVIYFLGFNNSTIKPSTLYFSPYVGTDRAAWVQSGSLAGMSLVQLQALVGTLIVAVDGTTFTSSNINLSTAASFSAAATMITAAFAGTGKPDCAWNSVNKTFTLTSATTGASSTISYVSGTMATGIKLTSATGAILSQGAAADTPASAMNSLKRATQNWVGFLTMWEPAASEKLLFADWTNSQNQRYGYAAWDTDEQAIVDGSTTCFGAICKTLEYDGIWPLYNTLSLAAFLLGTIASIDFSRRNGRITTAFRSQSGFPLTVTDKQVSDVLLANGYSYYGSYATANDVFEFLYNGQSPGKWKWIDPYVNQVYLNSQFQLALMTYLTSVNSSPFTPDGYSAVRASCIDPINQALNCGIIRSGVTLSSAQKSQVNQAAGLDIATYLEQLGYYLQILDPGAQVRGLRGSPIINFWYTDGGAVQKISMSSVDIM